jgi:tetrahydromethanopterin S-methyltransferase subunit B
MALVACGGGDTKESVQKTVDDLQTKLTEAMSGYQNAFQSESSDVAQAKEKIDKAAQMIDDAIAACDSVEAPGPDSQKYRDTVKDLLGVLKNMMNEISGVDTSDSTAAMEIAQKYLSDMASLRSEKDDTAVELAETKAKLTNTEVELSQSKAQNEQLRQLLLENGIDPGDI